MEDIMAFDFKKEYKEFYILKNKPAIVNVPKANYIAVRGKGNPNEEGGAYQQAISVLYAVAVSYTHLDVYKRQAFQSPPASVRRRRRREPPACLLYTSRCV